MTTSTQTYYAYGTIRTTSGTLPTDYTFTGQKQDASDGLMYYGARYYDAALGRFIQPDTLVPNLFNPQSLNRYAYVRNNPLKYTDPTGHMETCGEGEVCGKEGTGTPPPPYNANESYLQAVGLGVAWFFNIGQSEREFGSDSSLTQDIMHDPGMNAFREEWAQSGYQLPFRKPHTRDDRAEGSNFEFDKMLKAIPIYFYEHVVKMTLVSMGYKSQTPEGQWDAAGGTIGSLDMITAYDAGNGMVDFEVVNTMNWISLIRTPGHSSSLVMSEIPGTGRRIDSFLREYAGGRTDHIQFFRWREPAPTR